jgi:hypothetical protein
VGAGVFALAASVFAGIVMGTASADPTVESLWTTSVRPSIQATRDPAAVELGTRFIPAVNGSVQGIRFYKGTRNTGIHTGALWSPTGDQLAEGVFTQESASGWQTLVFAQPVPVTARTMYTASYWAPSGHYAENPGYFARPHTSGDLFAPRDAGVYVYGSQSLPRSTWRSSNYWVDVLFLPTGTPPPPTTTSVAPPTTTAPTTTTAPARPTTTAPTKPTTTTTTATKPPTTTTPPAAPVPTSWPTTSSTGATGTLTGASGDVSLKTNGQVYQNVRLNGTISVLGCGVTVRNVEVDAGEAYRGDASEDLFAIWDKAPVGCTTTIDHVSVITDTSGSAPYATEAVRDAYGAKQLITSSKFVGQQLGVTVGTGDTIQDNYIELGPTMRGDHNENILDDGTSSLTIEHNTLLNPNGQTSTLSLFTEFGANRNFLIQDNLLAGGGYTCYCGDGAADNSGNPARASSVSFVDNVFWEKYFPTVGQYGPGRAYNPAGGGQWTGNVYMLANGTVTSQVVRQPALDGQ